MTSVLVMGVLNTTPDSFSDGGRYDQASDAVDHARLLVAQGARIIDVGGESTRPGATPVEPAEEQRRALPIIEALVAEGIAVSVDTIHAETARLAARAGASYLNDVSGGTHDPEMLRVAAECAGTYGTEFIIGHWRGFPDPTHRNSFYDDVVVEVCNALAHQRDRAVAAGVDSELIILDPGLGFDKTGDQCWELLANLGELRALGHRVLLGASRKRMLAELLDRLPEAASIWPEGAHKPETRDLATAVTSAFAADAGAWGVRVHDVAASVQALAVNAALASAKRPMRPRDSAAETGGVAQSDDRVTLTGLEVFAHHGVFDFERETGQRFIVDADLSVDLAAAAREDALNRTVHYGELAAAISRAVSDDPVDLIETVAERVANVALGFAGVDVARITVHKPEAPIEEPFSDVSVTVVRRRNSDSRGLSAGGARRGESS